MRGSSLVFSVPWEFFLTKKIQDQKNIPQIILKERPAHLAIYTFTHVDQYQNTSLLQLYQTTKNTFFTEHLSLNTFVLWILQSF